MSSEENSPAGVSNSVVDNTDRADWWRTVLGEYPTGVTLVTSLDESGAPVAMVVGTFSAVSQDPPLVGFMPNGDSTTFPAIRARGRFVANVLGANHEAVCRAFAKKSPDRFSSAEWVETETGIPRLENAVAWFDASITDVHVAGDHDIVVASVNDFGVGDADAGLPLLFLRGGYGSFTVPSLTFDAHGYARQLKLADAVRDAIRDAAEELDAELVVCGLSGDSVVVLHAMNIKSGVAAHERPVGASFPFAAPLAPSFAAWGTEESVKTWIENARHLTGTVDRAALTELLEQTRARGFAVTRGDAVIDDFNRVVSDPEAPRSELARVWQLITQQNDGGPDAGIPADATAIQFPIFDESGTAALVVAVTSFRSAIDVRGGEEFAERVRSLSRDLTAAVGGRSAR
ncbi:flavin reductase [Microbacterium sp. A8/3-1]|uniref:Flavin reductase n=1 Tax=Microbacterium sp. A8/3-1 TaxID=3160749 RepID=A0AAU7VVL1_9MICO